MNIDELAEQVAQKLDIEGRIRQTLSFLPPEDIAALAEQTSPYMWADIPTNALRKIKRAAPLRVIVDEADVNLDENDVGVGHAGPTMPDILHFHQTDAWLETGDGRELHLRPRGGGGADCMFDYLVSSCWATEVAAGRGTEGQTMTSLTGCTFIVYSTIAAALNAHGALGINEHSTVFVCRGTYAEQITISSTNNGSLHLIGSGSGNTLVKPASGSGTLLGINTQTGANNVVQVTGFTFDASSMSANAVCVTGGGSTRIKFHNNTIVMRNGGKGIVPGNAGVGWEISHVNFQGAGGGIYASGDTPEILVCLCHFESGVTTGVEYLNSQRLVVTGCEFRSTTGVLFTSFSSGQVVVAGNLFFNNTNAVQHTGGTASAGVTSSTSRGIAITGNTIHGATTAAIDFASLSGNIFGIDISGNTINAGTSPPNARLGIVCHATKLQASMIGDNTFTQFTAGNEVTGITVAQCLTAATQIAHNSTDSGTPIIDSGLGHSSAGSGMAAPNSEAYVTIGNTANLSAERALTAGNGVGFTDAGANSTVTLKLVPLTALYDQSGAFNWVNRGGDLLIANSKSLKIYSDDSTTPSTLVANIDGANGNTLHLGYMRVGSVAAPTNTTAGDLTATRLIVPNATILHSAVTQIGGPVVIPGDGALLFSDNTNYVGIKSPATPQSENYIYELPDDDPADGQVLAVKSIAGSPTISTEWVDQSAGGGGETRVVLSAGQGRPATTSGCGGPVQVEFGTNDIDVVCLDFDATNTEYAIWERDLPAWDQGTVTYHVHWFTSSSTNTHTASFWLQGLAHGDSETLDAAYGTAIEVTDNATATANQHLKTAESAALTVGGTPADHDELITWRLSRVPGDSDDDLNVDARVLKVCITYTS